MLEKGQMIPSHVLLNTSGSLLLRRGKIIRPARRAMAFLQSLVATSRRSGVPLTYPEACTTDLSMIGSILNVFLQDNATLHALGFVSLYDTLRTRMLDPSLLCSSDRNYQFYAWDNIANLGLRGASTETVLRRGCADMTGYEGIIMRDEKDAVYYSYSIESRVTVNQISASNACYPVDMFFTWTCNKKEVRHYKNC
jgi:hypothetical protein